MGNTFCADQVQCHTVVAAGSGGPKAQFRLAEEVAPRVASLLPNGRFEKSAWPSFRISEFSKCLHSMTYDVQS